MADTRLPYETYIEHVRADGRRMLEVTDDLTRRVPSCPGWTAYDLLEHTAAVYLDKVACMRERRQPEKWPPDRGDLPTADHFRAAHATLIQVLKVRSPQTPAYTWWPPDQTAGFWARRMAQESLIHRVDAELAAGVASTVDETLARDGVDEVLTVFLGDPRTTWPVLDTPPCSVLVQVDDLGWLVQLRADGVQTTKATDGSQADAVVRGGAADVDLWLWGRGNLDPLRAEGSAAAIALLSERMVTATQ
jgi:uncharacterized protein (TIGR03083 family)